MTFRASAILLVSGCAGIASAAPTYLALGDSVAFGFQDDVLVRSLGVQGYVDDVAAALNARTGVAHDVLNLAIPGETSVSLGDTSEIGRLLNANYPIFGSKSQLDTLADAVAGIKLRGDTIDAVSFQIGANDFLDLTNGGTRTPTSAEVTTVKANVFARYASVLGGLRTAFPSALFILPGYYLPVAPGTAEAALLTPILLDFNLGVKNLAAANGGRYADFYGAISGHETEWILPGIHPNDAGYDALGRAAVQAVPEPSAWAALGLGLAAILRRRGR